MSDAVGHCRAEATDARLPAHIHPRTHGDRRDMGDHPATQFSPGWAYEIKGSLVGLLWQASSASRHPS